MTKAAKTRGGNAGATDNDGPQNPIELVMLQLEEGMVLRVHRIRDDGTRAFVTQIAPQDHIEFEIAKQCGPGKYLVVLWGRRQGETKARHQTSTVVHIDAAAVPLEAAAPAKSSGTSADRLGMALDGAVLNVFDTLAKASEFQARMMERAMAPAAPPASSPIIEKFMDALIPIAAAKLGDMLMRPNDTMAQALELADKLNAGKKSGSLTEVKDALAILRELREMAPANRTDDDEPAKVIGDTAPWWAQSAERLTIALAGKMLGPRAGQAIDAQLTDAQLTALPPGTPADIQEGGGDVVMPSDLEALQSFIKPLTEWAEQQRSPAWVAETLRFELDPQYHPLVLAELSKPGLVERLATFVVRLRPHKAWLEQVRVKVLEALGGAGATSGGDAPGEAGTGAAAGENGGTSNGGGRSRQARGGQPKQ